MANNNQQIPIGIVAPAVKGDWLSAMTYNVLNIVRHNNATYMSKVKNVGIEPGASTSWENTWALLVQDGEKGDTGNGIVSIEETGVSEDTLTVTYTILFTDGSSTTFDVKNGNGIKQIEKTSTDGLVDTYTITFTNGTTTTFQVKNGEQGIQGIQGETGNGILGISLTDVDGLNKTYTITFTNADVPPFSFIVKDGQKGDTGNGISSISKTSSEGLMDTYTILFTNGSTTTFIVTNGEKGDTGNGIASISLASVQGLVKTYNINFTNGTQTQFSVTDGEKGDTGNGISNIELTSTNGLEKTYTIYFTDGNTTTFVVTDGEGVPAGGDEGDVLVKNSSTNYDCVWVPQSQLSVGNDQYGNNISNSYANALKGTVSGIGVAITDVSPIEHELGVKVESKNLIPYPYYQKAGTVNGITFTDNGDGSLTLNGTATAGIGFALYLGNMPLKGKYTLSGVTNGGTVTHYLQPIVDGVYLSAVKTAPMTYDINGNLTHIMLSVNSGASLNNVVVKPQLEAGAVATEYTPYVKPNEVTVTRYGKNLVSSDLWGDLFEKQADGSYKSTKRIAARNEKVLNLPAQIYTISYLMKSPVGCNMRFLLTYIDDTTESQFITSDNTYKQYNRTTKGKAIKSIGFAASEWSDEVSFKDLQIECGAVATDYEPYVEPVTFMPAEGGLIEGVYSIYPTTTLIPDTAGVIIDVKYNRDLNKAFAELCNAIISLGGNV